MILKTKIVATIGPASCSEEVIRGMILNGAAMCRFNIKHNTAKWHLTAIKKVRTVAKSLGLSVGIIVDIPKLEMADNISDADYVAISYLKNAKEIEKVKKIIPGKKIIAKIENGDALKNLESILDISDGVMVARGDLGIEVPIEQLAYWQKRIIELCRIKSIPVIVATQMLQSMTKNESPTRAEATDVANAVFDGADALMLSEESAVGEHPVESVKAMAKIAKFNENLAKVANVSKSQKTPSELLVESAATMLQDPDGRQIKAAVVFSQSGKSVKLLSSYHCSIPLIAVTDNMAILNCLNLSFGVIPTFWKFKDNTFEINNPIFTHIKSLLGLKPGEMMLIIHGNNWITKGSTSNLSIKTI